MSKKLFKSTLITGSMTFLSRVLGFIRDIVIARLFGANLDTDAFFVAFKIPNFLRRLFAEGAFSQAFVPVLSEYKSTKDNQESINLIDNVAGMLAVVLLLITVLGIIFAPIIIMIFAPGYLESNGDRFELASSMLRITFPYLLLISLTAFACAILNTHNKFAAPAFAPTLLNISIILSTIFISPNINTPVYALAIGVTLGGVAQLVFILPFLKKINCLPKLKFNKNHPGVKKVIKLIIPALFGVSVSQINLLLDTIIASFLVAKSISWLYYADRLLEFPLGVFGVALATVILPSLAKAHSKKQTYDFKQKLDWSLRMVVIFTVPAMFGLFLLSEPLLITLFQYGKFNFNDTIMSSYALQAYSFGLLGFIAIKVLANGYFSRQNTKTPVKIGIIAMFSNMVLNLIFVGTFLYFDYVAPHVGLALATTCSAIINAGLLYFGLVKEKIYRFNKDWVKFIIKIITAVLLMILCINYFNPKLVIWQELDALGRSFRLLLIISSSILIYFVSLKIMKVKITMSK